MFLFNHGHHNGPWLSATIKNLTKIYPEHTKRISFIKRFHPQSVQKLADITHRKKQAVNRDLKMFERLGIIELRKQGRIKIPIVKRDTLILNLQQKESPQEIFLTHTSAQEIIG